VLASIVQPSSKPAHAEALSRVHNCLFFARTKAPLPGFVN